MISDDINQICFVFKDIEKNIEIYKKLFKFSSEVNILDVKVKKNIYKEKIEPFKIKLAMTTMGKTQLEFIQPLEGESIYKKFIERQGKLRLLQACDGPGVRISFLRVDKGLCSQKLFM